MLWFLTSDFPSAPTRLAFCALPRKLPPEYCNPRFALFTGKFNICTTCNVLKHYNTCSLNAISTHTCNSKPPSALNTCWFSTDFFWQDRKTTVKYFNFPYILAFMLFFRKVDEAWNNRRFFPFIGEIHINATKSEESIQNPRIAFQ